MALDQAFCTFYVMVVAAAEFGLPADNKKFSTQNAA
jgi:hypothetical protein